MQDKSYAIAIVVILLICCLGMYVAVSGYLNSNPAGLTSSITPILQTTPVAITIPTDTPLPIKPVTIQPRVPTAPPIPSPLGAFQTITAATTAIAPTLPQILPATKAPPASTAASAPAAQSCAGFAYCWKNGAPDIVLGPTGNECPRNYIWGLVTDVNGKGMPNIRIRYRAPNGEIGETTTKDKPDVPGKYDVPAERGTFVVWVSSGGAPASPQVSVLVQPHGAGSSVCLMRVDFFQQK